MKFLLTLLLTVFYIFSSAQINKDSLFILLLDESKDATKRLEALRQFATNDFLYSNPDSAIQLAKIGLDLAKSEKMKNEMLNFKKEIQASQCRSKELSLLFLGILSTTIFAFIIAIKKRKEQHLIEREKLLNQIKSLKKKLSAPSLTVPISDRKSFSLNRKLIEKAINSKIGESSWNILNLLFNNPSISNKEIAEEVSLSIEGVSSSLRRMYQAFDIKTSSNKKITLIMKATRLSFEK